MVSIPPGSSLGRYRIVEELGKGGMATVFRCHDPNLDRFVAVKVLPSFQQEDPTFIARFSQEARTVAALNHPNILAIYDFGEDKGFLYIVSELVPGGDLQDKMTGKPLSAEDVLEYMRPLSGALDFAHGEGIVHRDLKPANILLDADSRPILADFGLARMLESATRFTQAQQALGTPEYMAPEQAMGADADHRSDLYAFGIIIYQMLVGQTPFRADTPAATLMAHVHQPLPLPSKVLPGIAPSLEATLLKALAKEPDERFNSAAELVQAIEVASGLAPSAPISDDMGATAVMDTSEVPVEDSMEAPIAVLGTEAALQAGDAAAQAAGAVEAAPKPGVSRNLLMAVGGAVAAVAVVVVAALVLMSGGEGDEPTGDPVALAPAAPVAAPPDGAAPAAAEPAEEAEPAMSLAEAVAALDKLQTRAESNVVELRGVTPEGQIVSEFKTTDQLEAITRGFYRRETLRQQVFEAEQLYKVLGLMKEEEFLEDILLGIQLQQVTAVFDDESEKVYIVSDATNVGALAEIGIVAAYMGGVQQAQFDTFELSTRARLEDADQHRAVSALIKGDVSQVVQGYISSYFTQEQFDELSKPLPGNLLLQAPDVVQKANRFLLRDGQNFVATLFDTDSKGWEGVDTAYGNPPLSTEQVLHPEKYCSGEEPQRTTMPNFADQMGRGWEEVGANSMGEFLLRTCLEEHLTEFDAAKAAAGWGGDRYSLLSGPAAERLLILQIRWDSVGDSTEFFEAYKTFATIKATDSGGTSEDVGPSGKKWVMPGETVFVGQVGPAILLVIGDDEPLVGQGIQLILEALSPPTP